MWLDGEKRMMFDTERVTNVPPSLTTTAMMMFMDLTLGGRDVIHTHTIQSAGVAQVAQNQEAQNCDSRRMFAFNPCWITQAFG